MHDDPSFALMCREECGRLQQNIERHAWDGGWYRRAWFDDGTPLGTASNSECRIDLISQSWSVLSGAGDAARCRDAMKAVDEHLVRRADGLIQLLDPPFDTSSLNPGYIRGYVPGCGKTAGSIMHAAIWAAMAFAAFGEREHAWALTSMINPVNHARTEAQLAVHKIEPACHGRRCLCGRAAYRSRRMELRYRCRRLDVSAGAGIPAGSAARRRQAAACALHSGRLEGLHDPLSLLRNDLSHHGFAVACGGAGCPAAGRAEGGRRGAAGHGNPAGRRPPGSPGRAGVVAQ